MANRLLLCAGCLWIGFAASIWGADPVDAAVAVVSTPQAETHPDPGVFREEIPVETNHRDKDGTLARRPPLRVPPPLEEIVVYQDSLNGLTISNQGAWTHVDNSAKPPAWHIDTFLGCQGKSWWCGRVDSTWTFDTNRAGYENSWTQYLGNSVWLDSLGGQAVRLAFRHRFNAETNYDFGTVEVFDPTDDWIMLATYTGKVPNNSTCDSASIVIPDSIIAEYYADVQPGSHPRVQFRFGFKSDVAYSSQDGLYDGDGWVIDNITVRSGNEIRFFDDCESGQQSWSPSIFPPAGDLFSISSNVYTEDICTENRTNVWSDWDPITLSVVPRLDNLLRTPSVFVNRANEVFVAFDVYRNLPLWSCFYYHLRYRTRNAGAPWGSWVDPTRLLYYGSTKDWARQQLYLTGASGKDSVQVEFALTDYSAIYCDGIGSAAGTYTFFDNVAIGVVATAPPLFIQRDLDLFNDTFQTTAFFRDDNFNSAVGDSAVVEVSASRGFKRGWMKYRFNGGPWDSTALLPALTALPRLRYADVPPFNYPANTLLEYYFSATDSFDVTAYLPRGAITDGDYFSASVLPRKSPTNPALSCFDSLASILFVNNFAGRETRNLWIEAMTAMGYKFDVWDVNAPTSGIGNTPGGAPIGGLYSWPATAVDQLYQYSTIIWHAGSLSSFTLSQQDQALLQAWIQQTGKNRNLWIAGDNVANELIAQRQEYNAFMGFTCGATLLRGLWEQAPQDSLHPVVTGFNGSPSGGHTFHANADCPIIDKFDLLSVSSQAISNGKSGLLLKYPNNLGAATRYATKYVTFGTDSARVVFMGFNFNSIEEGNERFLFTKAVLTDYMQEPACYSPSAVQTDPSAEAPAFRNVLQQNAPNPFNPVTTIRYAVAATGPVTIRIFNAGGALVRTLVDSPHAPGEYTVRWDGRDEAGSRLGSGVYFYRIEMGSGFRDAKKLILIK